MHGNGKRADDEAQQQQKNTTSLVSPEQNIRMPPTMQASNVNDNTGGEVVMSSVATKFIALELKQHSCTATAMLNGYIFTALPCLANRCDCL